MAERVLVDTGPMVALFSADDSHHGRCRDALKGLTPRLVICLNRRAEMLGKGDLR